MKTEHGEQDTLDTLIRLAAVKAGHAMRLEAARKQKDADAWLEANKPRRWDRGFSFESWPDDDAELHRLTWEYLKKKGHYFEPKRGTTWEHFVVEALLHQLETAFAHLKKLGSDDDGVPSAILGFAEHTLACAELLNDAARDDRLAKLLLPFSRQQIAWPCFKSPHRQFFKDEERLLDTLQVAKGDPRILEKHANWNPNDAAGRVAVRVWQRFHTWRSDSTSGYFRYFGTRKEWRQRAKCLPPFDANRAAVLAWSDLAKAYVKAHPDEFDAARSEIKVPSGKRRRGGGISSHAFTMLRDKFLSMGGFNQV